MGDIQQFIVGIAVGVGIIEHEFEFRLDLGRDQSATDKLAQMIREAAQLNAWYVGHPYAAILAELLDKVGMYSHEFVKFFMCHQLYGFPL